MATMKDPARRINRVPPSRGEWVDLDPLGTPLLEPYPAAWYRRDVRESAIPKWLWDKWREDPVTSQWSPGDHALALELGASYYGLKPELRFKMQSALGLNAAGRRSLRWRNRAETEGQAEAVERAKEARRLRIVKPDEQEG